MDSRSTELQPTTQPQPMAVGGIPPMHDVHNSLTPARKAWVENVSILLRYKVLIFSVAFAVTAIVGVYAFLRMPNYYKARAVVLPARHAGGALDNVTSGLA